METQIETEVAATAKHLRILSVETRFRILLLLRDRDLCVGALARCLGLTQGAVSQHLKVLRDAGLVTAQRDGYYVHYRVDKAALAQWSGRLAGLFEQLQLGPTDEEGAGDEGPTPCNTRKGAPCVRKGRKGRETAARKRAT